MEIPTQCKLSRLILFEKPFDEAVLSKQRRDAKKKRKKEKSQTITKKRETNLWTFFALEDVWILRVSLNRDHCSRSNSFSETMMNPLLLLTGSTSAKNSGKLGRVRD